MKYKKIILNIKGGLGNQIFQIIAALNYCKINNINQLYINTLNLNNYKVIRKMEIDLNLFEFSVKINLIEKKNILLSKRFIQIIKLFNNKFIKIINENSILKRNNSFINILDGYFQTKQSLFLDNSLLDFSLQFDKIYSSHLLPFLLILNIDFDNDYGLHIRGSDFLGHKQLINNDPILILKKIEQQKIFVFTDDKLYALKLLKDLNKKIIFISDYNLTDLQEFILISKFRNMIITNSTFSLTASMLNLQNNKNIMCPFFWHYSKRQNNELLDIINNFKFITY
jgi:hypothetical protein